MQEKEEKNRAPKYSQGREAEEYEKGCEINKKSAIKRDTTPPHTHTNFLSEKRKRDKRKTSNHEQKLSCHFCFKTIDYKYLNSSSDEFMHPSSSNL